MRIRSLAVSGFRGFNEERTIPFHDRITLIYAPNSYGKTSISEAFEFLIYGVTSKVEAASSKEEYKGSYRNRHYPADKNPSIRLEAEHNGIGRTLVCELEGDATPLKFVEEGGSKTRVDTWPIKNQATPTRPFILQHALKNLLLATPDERFHGLARLLGLDALDGIHSDIIALCTKPDKSIPPEVSHLLSQVQALEGRVSVLPSLTDLQDELAKKDQTPDSIIKAAFACAARFVPAGTKEGEVLPALLKRREEEVGKVFSGHVTLPEFPQAEIAGDKETTKEIIASLSEEFVQRYTSIAQLASLRHIEDRARFLEIGMELLAASPSNCPFCGRRLEGRLEAHIERQHSELAAERAMFQGLSTDEKQLREALSRMRGLVDQSFATHTSKSTPFLANEKSFPQLEQILSPPHQAHIDALRKALHEVSAAAARLEQAHKNVHDALDSILTSLEEVKPDQALIRPLVESVLEFGEAAKVHRESLATHTDAASQAEQLIQHQLDRLAGTEELALLVDIIEFRTGFAKHARVHAILDNLKSLRKAVDTYVAERMEAAVSGDLTSRVLEWYEQIRTEGDPDVHFDGFEMDRTKRGTLKARRIQIKAQSYGEELVSAVSSLSESKLNALGLCLSIATNLDPSSPFEFLIIDDPIQSLDAEHEAKFVQVIRQLAEAEGKQIILLSHNGAWLDQVRTGCKSLNGYFYEITGYTRAGPNLKPVPWVKWQHRLSTVDAIVKDPQADSVRLQQAEEEIRLVVSELTAELYFKKTSKFVPAHRLNSAQVSKMLTECGVPNALRDRICQTFETTDDAHHGGNDFAPFRQRIKTYHSWAHELAALLST